MSFAGLFTPRLSAPRAAILLATWLMAPPVARARVGAPGSPLNPLHTAIFRQAIDHFYNLEYDDAIALFEQLRAAEPTNATAHNYVASAYFYKELYVTGALHGDLFGASNKYFRGKKPKPDPVLDRHFDDANRTAIRLCESGLKEDEHNQDALYACGVAYATRATHQGLIERSALDFMGSARKANAYHARLVRLNPRCYDAYLVPGIYEFVLGSLPRAVKLLFFWAGLNGDKSKGIEMVKSVVLYGDSASNDARILLAVMYRREKRFEEARQILEGLVAKYPRNYLVPLEIASLRRAQGDTAGAIRDYEHILDAVRSHKAGYEDVPIARVHFELGDLYRTEGNLEAARGHLRQVPGQRGTSPELEQDAAQRLAQIEQALGKH